MKKFLVITAIIVLALSFAGCRRNSTEDTPPNTTQPVTTVPTTEPTTMPSIIPSIDPTIETNIPDPDVDTSMPEDFKTESTLDTQENNRSRTAAR